MPTLAPNVGHEVRAGVVRTERALVTTARRPSTSARPTKEAAPATGSRRRPSAATTAGTVQWTNIAVDGRRVAYGVTGAGPPALFLHGWGLGPNAYRRPILAMAAAGCRVYAPALPGFGGTHELSAPDRSFAGYGAWAGRFLDAVGVDDVALVAGHSFGGGVATAFVHAHPERASSLLLANAVGGPTWAAFPDELRTMVQRPVWDWVHHLSTDVMTSPGLVRLLPTLIEDFVPNLIKNPLGMFRTGEFIRRADLLAEIGDIAAAGIPVVVAWSDRDRSGPALGLRRHPPRRRRRRCRGGGSPHLVDLRPSSLRRAGHQCPRAVGRAHRPRLGDRLLGRSGHRLLRMLAPSATGRSEVPAVP